MKMPVLFSLFFLHMLVFSLTAGCIETDAGSSQCGGILCTTQISAPTTVLPTETRVSPTTTTVSAVSPDSDLSALAITQSDIPIFVVVQKLEMPVQDAGLNEFDVISSYHQILYVRRKEDSYPGISLAESITQFPPGNAAPAFQNIEKGFRKRNDPTARVIWLQDPKIGDESFAISFVDPRNITGGIMIVFRKANVIEAITMVSDNPDIETMTGIANAAAVKVPSAGLKNHSQAVPVISAVALAGPVMITPSSNNSVEKITFTLQLNPGNRPVDMSQNEYTLTTPNYSWHYRDDDPTLRKTWIKIQGEPDTLLGPGEAVMIELNTATAEDQLKHLGTGERLSIFIIPQSNAALGKSCGVLSPMIPGQPVECY